MICDDCGRGFRCDAYESSSGDRCLGMAIQNVPLDLNGWSIVQIQLCEEHITSYRHAGEPLLFTPTPEQVAEAQRIADARAPLTRDEQRAYDAQRRKGFP